MQQPAASAVPALSAERRRLILATLERDGRVIAARLTAELGVSEDTIRRDLRELDTQGLVQRVHGGALPSAPSTAPFDRRRETATAAKAELAGAALAAIASARVLILDGSTTNLEVARRLPPGREGTVLTNSPPIAGVLASHPRIETIVVGGRLDPVAQVTVGAVALDFLRSVRADACLLGLCALHPDVGVTTNDLEESYVKRAMVDASAEVIALATTDKLRAASPYLVSPVSGLTQLVTEAGTPETLLEAYRAEGLTVTRA